MNTSNPVTSNNSNEMLNIENQFNPAFSADSEYEFESKPFNKESALKAGLSLLNAAITALETLVWQGREIVDEAALLVKEFDQDREAFVKESKELASKAQKLPGRIKRMAKTALTLSLITGSYRLWGTRSAFIPKDKQAAALNKLHQKNAWRFKRASLEHGGAFLKVGQLISARADIMPEAWVSELQVLQDQASPVAFREIKEVLEAELGKPMDEVFKGFVGEPIAAASIGQVHEAILMDGRRVAVKVQRPNIDEIVTQDMVLMKLFLKALEPMLPPTDIETISNEVERAVIKELCYKQEAKWLQKVGDFLREHSEVIVPKAVPELCTEKVLVSEFIDGEKLTTKLDALMAEKQHEVVSDLLGKLLDCYVQQVLIAGVFQADPHPGNILVTKDNQLVLLDFGCTMVLPHNFKIAYRKILFASIAGDKQTVADTLMELGFKTRSGKPDTLLAFADALLETLQNAVKSNMNNQGNNNEINWPSSDEIFREAVALLKQAEGDPVEKLPAEFIMLARVFSTLSGLFTFYKPKLDVQKYLLPHLQLSF